MSFVDRQKEDSPEHKNERSSKHGYRGRCRRIRYPSSDQGLLSITSSGLAKCFDWTLGKRISVGLAARDILSDITPVKSAIVGKRTKADERPWVEELAESERLGER
jgi:hypothetical protein